MWQRFTERARRVILLGQEEAMKMESGHVGSEHLLLGLIREGEGVAAQVLQKMDVSSERVRQEIGFEAQPSTGAEHVDPSDALSALSASMNVLGAHLKLSREHVRRIEEETLRQLRKGSEKAIVAEPKLTPTARRILELAADEARRMRHNYIGTEHLLLALLREKDETAAAVLHKMGLSLEETRRQVTEYLAPAEPATRNSSSVEQSSEQWQLVGELIQTVQMAVDALASSGKGKKDKLEVVIQKLEELKNKHQANDADNSSEN